jgi:hypothetical protein
LQYCNLMETSWNELSSTRLRQLDCNRTLSCVSKIFLKFGLLMIYIWGRSDIFIRDNLSLEVIYHLRNFKVWFDHIGLSLKFGEYTASGN